MHTRSYESFLNVCTLKIPFVNGFSRSWVFVFETKSGFFLFPSICSAQTKCIETSSTIRTVFDRAFLTFYSLLMWPSGSVSIGKHTVHRSHDGRGTRSWRYFARNRLRLNIHREDRRTINVPATGLGEGGDEMQRFRAYECSFPPPILRCRRAQCTCTRCRQSITAASGLLSARLSVSMSANQTRTR